MGIVTVGVPRRVRRSDRPARQGRRGVDYMRVRGFPFGEEVASSSSQHDVNFIVEQNRDAQLRSLLMLETGIAAKSSTRCVITVASR